MQKQLYVQERGDGVFAQRIEKLLEAGYTFVEGCLSISSSVAQSEYGKQQTFFGAALWLPGMNPDLVTKEDG